MTANGQGDTVAIWDVSLSDGNFRIEFEHGTTTGKRIIKVNGNELIRRDWMFKLVGREDFYLGKKQAKCSIFIDTSGGFSYEYSLEVNGKSLEKFVENQNKVLKTWYYEAENEKYRVVLEKDTLDIWVNGQKVETAGEFVDEGTETHFEMGGHKAYVQAISGQKKRDGIIHTLFVDNKIVSNIEH